MNIVAEGVETKDALAVLIDCGCDEIQGYLVGAAQPVSNLLIEPPAEVRQLLNAEAQVRALRERVEEMRGPSTGPYANGKLIIDEKKTSAG